MGNVKVSILLEPIWASAGSHEKGFLVPGLDLGSDVISSIFAEVESSTFSLRGGKGRVELSYYTDERSMYIYGCDMILVSLYYIPPSNFLRRGDGGKKNSLIL